MVGESLPQWQNRSHFFAIASRAMRQILVDHARRRGASKRGDGVADLSLDEALVLAESESGDLIALDEALSKLAAFDERKCKIVEMRYFGGCTVEETAEALGLATITVIRETRVAEAWLRRAMQGDDPAV
jgi:RNA polymerase sigma factor (TIGR02999 family)